MPEKTRSTADFRVFLPFFVCRNRKIYVLTLKIYCAKILKVSELRECVGMTAENLKTQRERCGFTRSETEELLCLKRGTVEKWETGKKKLDKNDAQMLSAFFMRPLCNLTEK